MAIKVEVVNPVSSVSETTGESTAIVVVKTATSPISTNGSQAVVDVVGHGAVGNVLPSQTEPPNAYNGMLWFSW